jgi:hypothetical protein
MKPRYDRVGFARAAIADLVPWVLERGTRRSEQGLPEYLELEVGGLRVFCRLADFSSRKGARGSFDPRQP